MEKSNKSIGFTVHGREVIRVHNDKNEPILDYDGIKDDLSIIIPFFGENAIARVKKDESGRFFGQLKDNIFILEFDDSADNRGWFVIGVVNTRSIDRLIIYG